MSFIADGNKTVTVVDRAFAAGETFTSQWYDVDDFDSIHIVAFTDTVSATNAATIEFADIEDDEIIWDASVTLAHPSLGGINVAFTIERKARFMRIRYTHGPIPSRVYNTLSFNPQGPGIPVYQMLFPLDDEDTAIITRGVVVRQDPDGDYVNQRQGGIHPDLSTDTPLTANGVFRSPWVEVQGFVYIGATIRTDQPSATDGASVQFAREVFTAQNIENITQANPAVVTITGHGIPDNERVLITGVGGMTEVNERYFFISVLDADTFELVGEDSTGHTAYSSGGLCEQVRVTREVIETVTVPILGQSIDPFAGTQVQDRFCRVEYFNGAVAQGVMNLHFHLMDVTQTGDLRIVASQEMEFSSAAQYTKALAYAHPDALSKPIPVFQDATTRGQYAHIVGFDARVPIAALDQRKTGQLNATSLAASQIPLESWVKTVAIKNMDSNENIFVGFNSSVTANTGFLISPLLGDSYPINNTGELWVISGAPVASTSTTDRFGASTVNSGALNPDNVLVEDGTFATLDDQGDNIDVTGYTVDGTFTDISTVRMGFKGRKSATTTVAIAHRQTVTGTAIGTPAVSTGSSVSAFAGDKYIAAISFEDTAQTVQSVSGLGLTWTFVNQETSGNIKLSVWEGTGTPTGSGIVTASFSAAAGDSCIAVSSYTSTDGTIQVSAIANDSGTAVSGSITSDFGDFVYAAIANSRYTSTPGAGFSERADFGTGTGPNDARLVIQDKKATTDPTTVDATLATAEEWAMVMLTLNIGAGTAPTVTLSHDLGPTTLVQQLDGTNTRYFVDITADRAWVAADITSVVLNIDATTEIDTDAEIDSVFLEVTEIDTGGLTRVCWMQLGDTDPDF